MKKHRNYISFVDIHIITQTETEKERERGQNRRGRDGDNWNLKTLVYKDCSLGSVKTKQLVLAKLLMRKKNYRASFTYILS